MSTSRPAPRGPSGPSGPAPLPPDVHTTVLNGVLQRVLLVAIAVGVPSAAVLLLVVPTDDPLVRWAYPPGVVYLGVYAWVLLRRPRRSVVFSRVTLGIFEVVWLVAWWVHLASGPDVLTAWHSLFPTEYFGIVVFLVVGFLYHEGRVAVVHGFVLCAGVLGVGTVGLLVRDAGPTLVRDHVRYVVYLVVVTVLLHALSQAKGRLAVAMADAERAEESARALRDMAYHDPLTGIANRRRLVEELGFRTAHVDAEHPVSVVLFDLDRFKQVNDTQGHGVGDRVLRVVADVTARVVREGDLAARLGGEEFVVVAGASHDRAVQLAERLRVIIPEEIGVAVGLRVTASFGVVSLRRGESAESVLERADALMYAAKSTGRDQVVTSGPA